MHSKGKVIIKQEDKWPYRMWIENEDGDVIVDMHHGREMAGIIMDAVLLLKNSEGFKKRARNLLARLDKEGA